MATKNITRKSRRHQKQGICVFTTMLAVSELDTSGDDYQLFVLPPAAVVTSAKAIVVTANDAATSAAADLGFDGGDELLAAADLTSAADTVIDDEIGGIIRETGGVVTITPTYDGTPTEGKILVAIEYIEYEKTTGEVTNFVPEVA